MSAAGIGKLSPNIIMLGFMHSWKERTITDMCSYYNIIHDAFTYNYGVVILHAPQGIFPLLDDFLPLIYFTGLTKTPETQSQNNLAESSPKKSSKKKNELLSCCASGGEDIELLGQGMGPYTRVLSHNAEKCLNPLKR